MAAKPQARAFNCAATANGRMSGAAKWCLDSHTIPQPTFIYGYSPFSRHQEPPSFANSTRCKSDLREVTQ
jgi:hypothetical protein